MAFERDFGSRRHEQVRAEAFDELGARATQSPANAYSDSVFGIGVTAASIVAGSAPMLTATGKRSPGMLVVPGRIVRGTAAMREPAHDDAVAADDLLAVDAEVLPVALGADASS